MALPLNQGGDPLALLRSQFPLPTESDDQLKKLLSQLKSTQTNQDILEALGKEEKPKNKPGLVDYFLSQERGLLFAPARFTTALALDALGYQDPEGELKKGNPLASAVRSAKGEFAITGGDLFKVQKGDAIGRRLAKYAAALAFDVSTDPTTYFGGINLFARGTAAQVAVRNGPKALPKLLELAGAAGRNADSVLDDLVKNSNAYKGLRAEFEATLPKTLTAAEKADELAKFGLTAQQKNNIAGFYLGDLIGQSLLVGGRPRIRKEISKLIGDDRLAGEFLSTLPAEISGGIYLRTITGRPVKRIAGGKGASNVVSEFLNSQRFVISAMPGRAVDTFLAGRMGPGMARLKKDLIASKKDIAATKGRLMNFVLFKDAMRKADVDLVRASRVFVAEISAIEQVKRELDKAGQETFERAFRQHFHAPMLGVPATADAAYQAGAKAAQSIRALGRNAYDEMKSIGLEIGDLGEFWTPMQKTLAAIEREMEKGVRGAGVGRASETTRPTLGRDSNVNPYDDVTEAIKRGFLVEGQPGIVYENAPTANARLRAQGLPDEYEEDPIKLITNYVEYAHRTISANRMVSSLRELGVVAKITPEIETLLNNRNAAIFVAAARTASPQAKRAAEESRDKASKALQEMVSPERLEQVQGAVKSRMEAALSALHDARVAEKEARRILSEADKAVNRARPALDKILARLRRYAKTGAEQVEAEAARLARNADARLARSRNALDDLNLNVDDARENLAIAEAIGTPEEIAEMTARRDAAEAAAQDRAAKLETDFVSVEEAAGELQAARNIRGALSETASREQLAEFQVYEQALEAQEAAAAAYRETRRARQEAFGAWNEARRGSDVTRASALDAVVADYLNSTRALRESRKKIGKTFKKMTPTEQAEYSRLKAVRDAALRTMEEVLGASTRKGSKGIVAEYARQIKQLADVLTSEELTAAKVIADVEKLNAMMDQISAVGVRDEIALNLMGDVYHTYKNIRKFVPEDALETLSGTYKTLLAGGKDALEREKTVLSEAAERLMDETELRAIGSGVSGQSVRLPKSLEGVYADAGVRRVMEDMYRMESSPNEWERFISRVYDPLALVWKTGVTVARGPAYTVTNTVGGLANNFLGRVSIKNHKLSGDLLAESTNIMRRVRQANPNASYFQMLDVVEKEMKRKFGDVTVNGENVVDLFVSFMERGGHFSTDLARQLQELRMIGAGAADPYTRLRGVTLDQLPPDATKLETGTAKLASFALNNGFQAVLNDVAQSSEIFLRFAAYLEGFARYGDLDSALDLTYLLHFNYQDLSHAEVWLKRIVPFYTWTRNNVPLQLRAMFTSSDQFKKLYLANENLKQAFSSDEEWMNQYLPDFMDLNGGFVSSFKFSGNHIGLFYKAPMMDANRILQVGYIGALPIVYPRGSEVLQSLGPVIKSPLEFISGRDLESGRELTGPSERAKRAITTAIPYYGTVTRALSAVGLEAEVPVMGRFGGEKQISDLMGLIVGAPWGATTYTAKTLNWAAIERNKSLSRQVREAAETAGVDLDWLRKQLRSGVRADQLATKIAAGEGDPNRKTIDELLGLKKKQTKSQDYKKVLERLRTGQ